MIMELLLLRSVVRHLGITYLRILALVATRFDVLVILASEYVRTHRFSAGSIVAWAQGRFFGAYIPEGSWFSQLQRAGMTVGRRSLPKTIVKIIGWAVVGLFGLGVAIFLAM